jgi:cytochrome c oxidase subunit 3
MAEQSSALAHQFEDIEQQRDAAALGMWVFLATEVMFFGGLFMGYAFGRWAYPQAFSEASHHLHVLIGGINTGVLLISSLFMALAVQSAQLGNRKRLVGFLMLTALLGVIFLGFKAIEYHKHYVEHLIPGSGFFYSGSAKAEIFFWLYFAMTGLHALHVLVGVGVITIMATLSWRGWFSSEHYMPIEVTGLYWHFVDIVWVFLFPLLYLIGHR